MKTLKLPKKTFDRLTQYLQDYEQFDIKYLMYGKNFEIEVSGTPADEEEKDLAENIFESICRMPRASGDRSSGTFESDDLDILGPEVLMLNFEIDKESARVCGVASSEDLCFPDDLVSCSEITDVVLEAAELDDVYGVEDLFVSFTVSEDGIEGLEFEAESVKLAKALKRKAATIKVAIQGYFDGIFAGQSYNFEVDTRCEEITGNAENEEYTSFVVEADTEDTTKCKLVQGSEG
jgi:hypothetical protein